MHGGRGAASAGLLALLPSCASLHADKHTYEASSPAVEVGGAMVRMQVRPEGADNAFSVSAMVVSTTVATLDTVVTDGEGEAIVDVVLAPPAEA